MPAFRLSLSVLALLLNLQPSKSTTVIPLAFACEFKYEKCCSSALASMQLAMQDANNKNGTLVKEFATTVKAIRLEVSRLVFPYDAGIVESFEKDYADVNKAPPVAVIGSYYSSRVRPFTQSPYSLGVSQLAWCSAPFWDQNQNYRGLFRIPPPDSSAVAALHSIIKLKNIREIAYLTYAGDAWSDDVLRYLKLKCSETPPSHACNVTKYELSADCDAACVEGELNKIAASGTRTIFNSVWHLQALHQTIYAQAAALGMAGESQKVAQAGYIWMAATPVSMDPKYSHYWHGSIWVTMKSMRPEKVNAFKAHWARNIPAMRLKKTKFAPLEMDDAHDPSKCLLFNGWAYESVARVRIALEKVNLGLPKHPGLGTSVAEWLGTSLRRELQRGVDMDGVAYGPNLRKSPALDMPWIENTAKFTIYNYAGADKPKLALYTYSSGSLQAAASLSQGILPGGVPFSSPNSGKQEPTSCNDPTKRTCSSKSSFGTCQLAAPHGGFSPGWCRCDAGYVGRFCNYRSSSLAPPLAWMSGSGTIEKLDTVPVRMTFEILSFDGLTKNGDNFVATIKLVLEWNDARFAFEDTTLGNEYEDSLADTILKGIWKPEFQITRGIIQSDTKMLTARRGGASEPNVTLSLQHRLKVQHPFAPSFQDFPFDKHSLHLSLKPSQADTRLILLPRDLVPRAVSGEGGSWNSEWVYEHASLTESRNAFTLILTVGRETTMTIYRVILPMSILVLISWAAFWITPTQLMPRFASGFISFLALQGFKSYAVGMMPNDGAISMSWIDIYISVVGILMGLAVIETVVSQYMFQNVSHLTSSHIDILSRSAFPLVYIVVFIIMVVPTENYPAKTYVVHLLIFVFVVFFAAYCAYQAINYPSIMIQSCVRKQASAGGRFKTFEFSEREMQVLFDYLNKMGRACAMAKAVKKIDEEIEGSCESDVNYEVDAVQVEQVVSWIMTSFRSQENKDDIQHAVELAFGTSSFKFPIFKQEFPRFITNLTLLLSSSSEHVVHSREVHADPKHAPKGIGARPKRNVTQIMSRGRDAEVSQTDCSTDL